MSAAPGRPRLAENLTLLRDRRFALLLTARSVSMLAAAFAPVALAFGVLHLPGATATTLSVVLAAEAVPLVLFLLVGGVIADRFPRQRVMRVSEWLSAAAFGAGGVMLTTGHAPTVLLVVAAAVSGIGVAMLYPALTGLIPEVVPTAHLQSGNALLALGANAARILGIAGSGALVVWIGGGPSLLVSAGLFAVAGLLIGRLHVDPRAPQERTSVLAELREGWVEFSSRQWIWVVVAQFSLLVMGLQAAHGVLGPVIADTELGGAGAWSLVLAGEAVGMVLGVGVALRWHPSRPILVGTLALFVVPVPYLLLGLSAPLWSVVLAMLGLGVAFELFGVLWQTTMQREVPPAALSRVSSYDALGSLMFGPIGLLLAGPVAIAVGAHTAMVGVAVLVVLTTLAALLSPEVRQLRVPAATAEDTAVAGR